MDDFSRDVYAVVREIPSGHVSTYGAIAKALGLPKGARRVGWVLNQSFGVVPPVPAHRVVNRHGQLSGAIHFPSDFPMAEQLRAEGVKVADQQVVDFAEVFWDPVVELCSES
ncbi:MAG: MGMT family protein [Flavobacteriales bacterium]